MSGLEALMESLPKAKKRWAQTDPVMAQLARDHPPGPRPEGGDDPFAALVTSIVHQQVSLAAGRTIYKRVVAATRDPPTPASVLAAGVDGLRAAGLSGQKTKYVLDLAERTTSGDLDFKSLSAMSDDDIIKRLTKVKGIGTWTAKMFLLFHLGRPDVLAPEDLGLRVAVAYAYGVPEARAAQLMEEKRRAWSPFASVAALVLWETKHALDA